MQTSLGTTRFFPSIHLSHLFCMIPCSYRASACRAVLPSYRTSYAVSIRQTRGLPVVSLFPHPASFRFAVACNTLAFGYILPATGRIQDLHLLETCAARRTQKILHNQRLSHAVFSNYIPNYLNTYFIRSNMYSIFKISKIWGFSLSISCRLRYSL